MANEARQEEANPIHEQLGRIRKRDRIVAAIVLENRGRVSWDKDCPCARCHARFRAEVRR